MDTNKLTHVMCIRYLQYHVTPKFFEGDLYRKGHFGYAFYMSKKAESSLRNVI
jgi:hypothetical protein